MIFLGMADACSACRGPDVEAVQRVHERAGHKADEIYEVAFDV